MRNVLRLVLSIGILCAAFAAGIWAHAQTAQPQTPQTPTIISGNDLGFRIDSRKGKNPVGVLVVRINGQWVEVESAVGLKRLTSR